MSYKIRPAKLTDYNELVEMYKDLIDIVYEGFEKGEDIFFHGTVQQWFQNQRDVIVCEKDGEITGFSLAYIEDLGFLKPYYFGDIAYVKPKYRKGRSAYLLYNNVVKYADQQNLSLVAKAFLGGDNQVGKIQAKFGEPFFMEYKRIKG